VRGRESAKLERQVEAVMEGCRAFVAIAALSLAESEVTITLPQWRVLVIVSRYGPQNPGAIAQWMGVHPSTATRACDALVRDDLLHREEDPADRRRLLLTLSVEGARLVESVLGRRREAIAGVLSGMPAERRGQLADAMREFADAVGDAPEREAAAADWVH
jgi:DNA-binding MarR family transcriptional regulator